MHETNVNGCSDHEHSELRMVYEVTVREVDRARQWAWRVTWQCVLALVAIYALYAVELNAFERSADGVFFSRVLCSELMFIALVYNGIYLYFSHRQLKRFRKRLKRCRRRFSDAFRVAHGPLTPAAVWPMFFVVLTVFTFLVVLMWRGTL